jgi:16S rRNA (adenine1518-N6/adenine1519-N6)-dimethyltransferase
MCYNALMDLISPKYIKELLSKHQTRPSRGLGQNFLIDKNTLDKIITSADIKSDGQILEVGPGIGTLTQELAKKAKKVVAVEKDKIMVEILKETLKEFNNVEIIQGDILKFKNPFSEKYKVIANIPYYLTSPLIRKFLEEKNPPEEIVLMIQKEVAQRICSKPPNMSLLAVSVQFYAEAKIISFVSKNCFWPSPKIDSAIIKITPKKKYDISAALFFQIVKAGFLHPRKQLSNNMSEGLKLNKQQANLLLEKNGLTPLQRAETLSLQDWVNLAKTF